MASSRRGLHPPAPRGRPAQSNGCPVLSELRYPCPPFTLKKAAAEQSQIRHPRANAPNLSPAATLVDSGRSHHPISPRDPVLCRRQATAHMAPLPTAPREGGRAPPIQPRPSHLSPAHPSPLHPHGSSSRSPTPKASSAQEPPSGSVPSPQRPPPGPDHTPSFPRRTLRPQVHVQEPPRAPGGAVLSPQAHQQLRVTWTRVTARYDTVG